MHNSKFAQVRDLLLGIAALVFLMMFDGCGGGSSAPMQQISISIAAPSSTLNTGATSSIVATVSNDSSNAGVDWSCMPAGSCGTFSPAHTASGAATTYTAPATAGSVTVIATATAQSSATVSAAVTISAPAPKLAITLSTPPPDSLNTAATSSIVATVSNDSSNAGVDWSCTPAGDCGTFNPAHTASGASTTYTAPGDAGSVTIVAAATASPNTTVSDTITVSASAPSGLSGNYAFYVRGMESNSNLYSLAGSFTLQASGAVTVGEQDFNDGTSANQSPAGGDQITGGTLAMGENERGTLTLTTNNSHLGVNGTETFHVVEVNTQHLLIEAYDSTATSFGSVDMQGTVSGNAALNGTYVFTVSGKAAGQTKAFGGTLAGDGNGNLQTTLDTNVAGTTTRTTGSGTYTAEDTFGRGTLSFDGNTLVYYAVKSEGGRTVMMRLVVTTANETDGGTAVLQADDTTSFDTSFIKGQFAFLVAGNHGNDNGSNDEGFVVAGQINADGAGNVASGYADESEGGTPNDQTSGTITGSYTLPTNGLGTLNIVWTTDHHKVGLYIADPDVNLIDPNSATNTGGALLLGLDAHIGDGVLMPQSATAMPSGNFALGFHAFTNAGETDGVGQVAVATGTIAGATDVNDLFHTILAVDADTSGTLTADASNAGRFTVPLTFMINGTPTTQTVVVYEIAANQFVIAQTDPKQLSSGVLEQQQ